MNELQPLFRTPINPNEIQTGSQLITYKSTLFLTGSCFVEHMGERFKQYRFNTLVNPYGIIFHPLTIEKSLFEITTRKTYEKKDLIFDQGLWHSLQHHSDFSDPDYQKVLETINQSITTSHSFLKNTSHVILTLGTAWVYHHIETDQLVANCHKIPQKQFVKRILSVSEIYNSLQRTVSLVQKMNPEIKIMLTVSPVRHLKDGMQNNALSKAHLLSAIYQTVDNQSVYYFPSYEIATDDLRDYRFYDTDMVHPNTTAVDYIWQIFSRLWIDKETLKTVEQLKQLLKDMNHRPFHPDSEKHQKFLLQIEAQKRILKQNHGIDF